MTKKLPALPKEGSPWIVAKGAGRGRIIVITEATHPFCGWTRTIRGVFLDTGRRGSWKPEDFADGGRFLPSLGVAARDFRRERYARFLKNGGKPNPTCNVNAGVVIIKLSAPVKHEGIRISRLPLDFDGITNEDIASAVAMSDAEKNEAGIAGELENDTVWVSIASKAANVPAEVIRKLDDTDADKVILAIQRFLQGGASVARAADRRWGSVRALR